MPCRHRNSARRAGLEHVHCSFDFKGRSHFTGAVAHASQFVLDVRHDPLLSHAHAQMHLQDADDPAIAAAWHVYMETQDFNDLADTMLRILRREARLTAQRAVDPQVSAIQELVQLGGLTPEEGTGLLTILAVEHKVRARCLHFCDALVWNGCTLLCCVQVLQAAFEAYHEDGNINELVDTLKLIHRWTSQPAAAPHAPHAVQSMPLEQEHPGVRA